MKKESQKSVVLEYLYGGGHLNQLEATRMWNITRLGSIINRLRNEGYPIPDKTNGVPCSNYFLETKSLGLIRIDNAQYLSEVIVAQQSFEWNESKEKAMTLKTKIREIKSYLKKYEKIKTLVVQL